MPTYPTGAAVETSAGHRFFEAGASLPAGAKLYFNGFQGSAYLTHNGTNFVLAGGDLRAEGGTLYLNAAQTVYIDYDETSVNLIGDDFSIPATAKLYLNGTTRTVYLEHDGTSVNLVGDDFSIPATAKLYLNGTTRTVYLEHDGTSVNLVGDDLSIPSGAKLYLNGATRTAHISFDGSDTTMTGTGVLILPGSVRAVAGAIQCDTVNSYSGGTALTLTGNPTDSAGNPTVISRSGAAISNADIHHFRVQDTSKSKITKDGDYLNLALDGTAGSGAGITVNVTSSAARHFVHKITVTEAALTEADGEQDVVLWTVQAKTKIVRVVADVTAAFTGGTISAFTISVGPAGTETTYLDAGNAFAGAAVYGDADGELGTSLEGLQGHIPSWSGTTAIEARFTATGDNVVNATAGSVTFYIEGFVYP